MVPPSDHTAPVRCSGRCVQLLCLPAVTADLAMTRSSLLLVQVAHRDCDECSERSQARYEQAWALRPRTFRRHHRQPCSGSLGVEMSCPSAMPSTHWFCLCRRTEIQEVVQSRFNLEVKERILRIHCRLDSDDLCVPITAFLPPQAYLGLLASNSDDAQQILQKVESLRNDGPHSGSFNLLAPLHLARGIVSLATEAAVLSTQINRSNAIILGFTTLLTVFNSWEGRYDNCTPDFSLHKRLCRS